MRLTQFSHGGGCGCKIAPGVLEQILAGAARGVVPPELMVGIETADEYETCRDLGIDLIQGYFFAHPQEEMRVGDQEVEQALRTAATV